MGWYLMGMGRNMGMEMGLGTEWRWYGIETGIGMRMGVKMGGNWE